MTMNTTRKLAAAAGVVAGVALTFGFAAPSSAAPTGRTNAEWNAECTVVHATSSKDISNVVYLIDGVEHRIEFSDGTHDLQLPGEISDLWIKAGNNKSGDGSGYGEHYVQPASCTTPPSVNNW
jgi:hypothetical protein